MTEEEVNQMIGKNLRRIRKSKEMSQESLAVYADISFQQIQKYERGTNLLAVPRLVTFAIALKTDIMEFFEGVDVNAS